MSGAARLATRVLGLAGATWGAVLLSRGPTIWQMVVGSAPSDVERRVIVVLGIRRLGQGLFQAGLPDHLQRLWVGVDLLHASSMAALALARPSSTRAAVLTGGIAAVNAVLNAILVRRAR